MSEHVREGKHAIIWPNWDGSEAFEVQLLQFIARNAMCRTTTMHDAAFRGPATAVVSQIELDKIIPAQKRLREDLANFGFRNERPYYAELHACISKKLIFRRIK
jgi:hypothetical protein